MIPKRPRATVWPLALAALAIVGPWIAGPKGPPSAAASAAQLLPPGILIQEVSLQGGGFLRAPELILQEDGIHILWPQGARTISGVRAEGPVKSRRLWLGTDHQGRDLLARTLHGARTSLLVASVAMLIALVIGTVVGLTSALAAAPGRSALQIGTDGLLALPRVLLLLMLGVLMRGSAVGVATAIGLASWMEVSRMVEAETRALEGFPFMLAVRATGAGYLRLAFRHLLPNLAPILAVAAPLVATEAILLESTLSFLGIGPGGGVASWGRMVADGQRFLPSAWWIAVFPGLLLCVTALAVHQLARPIARPSRPLSSP